MAHRHLRYLLASLLSGVFFWIAWPPHSPLLLPLLFVALVPLLWVEEHLSQSVIPATRGWVWLYSYIGFLTFNGLTTWWVCNASMAGGLFAIIANAFLMSVVWLLFHITRQQLGKALGYFSLVLYWLAFEYLHLRWELTWPWLTLGNGLAEAPALFQWYSLTGVLGGSLWILGANILIFRASNLYRKLTLQWRENPNDTDLRSYRKIRRSVSLVKILIVIGLPVAVSLIIWWQYSAPTGKTIEVVAVQPNIDPYHQKFRGSKDFIPYEKQVSRMLRLTDSLLTDSTDFVVWPETSVPGGMFISRLEEYRQYRQIRAWHRQHQGVSMVVGIDAYRLYGPQKMTPTARYHASSGQYFDAFNTALFLPAGTDSTMHYHKSKLVPGVERMPYPGFFHFLADKAIDLGGITGSLGTQKERTVFFDPDSIGIAPVICYESVFGDYVTDYISRGAQAIFIITNDGWWGNTAGYKQHLAYARLRAVETRRPIARSANTGTSAFIDTRGIIRKTTPWWQPTAIRGTMHLNTTITPYVQYGDVIGRTAALLAVLMLLYTFVSQRTRGFYYRRNR